MGFKNFKIWGIFMVAIIIVAFMLFQQSNTNKRELDQQAIRNMELVKGNFQVAFQSYTSQKLQEKRKQYLLNECYKKVNGKWEKKDNCKYTKFNQFDSLNVRNISFWQNNLDNSSSFILHFPEQSKDTINLEKLFSKINNQKFFEQVYLIDTLNSILFPSSEIGKTIPLFNRESTGVYHLPINKEEIVHNDENHLIYYTPVVIDKYKFYLVGVIKTSSFESAGMRVDFTNLTILVFLLGLMLFSLPILSFLGLTKGDKLTRFGVFSVGLSLVGLMVILGFGFSFFKNHHPLTDKDHENAIKEIRTGLQSNLSDKISLLDNWEINATASTPGQNIKKANDLIRINKLGGIDYIYQDGKQDTLNQIYRSLKHRRYYSYFLKPSENGTNFEFNKKIKSNILYIGSHYSLANSELESVLSKYSYCPNQVEAITFSWNTKLSAYDSLREFLLFKNNGLIIHKSAGIKVAADNLSELLSSKKWQEVRGIMNNNKSSNKEQQWEIPLYLDGHAFNGYLLKIRIENQEFDQDLWMIYFKDEHMEHVYSSLVTFETVILLLIYILILGGISLVNKLNKPQSKHKVLTKFAYNNIYPNKSKARNIKFLIWVLVVYVFIILYYYHLPSIHFFGMFIILVISTFHFKLVMFIILGHKWEKQNGNLTAQDKKRNHEIMWFTTIMGVSLVFCFFILFFFIHYIHALILLTLVVGSTVFCFKHRLSLNDEEQVKETLKQQMSEVKSFEKLRLQSFHLLYTCFFMMWIFMVGFIPGYVIYSKVHHYESKNWEPKKTKNHYNHPPHGFWTGYDEIRRQLFGNLTNQTNIDQISEFIFLDSKLLQPKIYLELKNKDTLMQPIKNLFEKFFWSILVTLVLLAILGFFIWLIYILTKKIYLLDFNGHLLRVQPPPEIIPQKVFLCAVDSDYYPEWVSKLLEEAKTEFTDCTSNPLLKWDDSSLPDLKNKNVWFIKNVHCLPDLALLLGKLPHFINAVKGKATLIIGSGVSWKELLFELKEPKQKIIFSQLFSSFHIEYVPIELDSKLKDISPNDEKASILIRSRKAYFYNIWAELSFEEKKICYYFSQEGFFNFTHKPVITELMQKGILVRNESMEELPKLFDKHFRLFILNNVTEEEIQAFKRDEEKHGNASSIQIAVFSFILLSVALISYFDKNFLDQASTFVAGITGALGGIYSLFKNSLPSAGKNKP
ncbi:hypothetical protein [Aquiflexum sp.]|uniref:hypothetical protein n=1 Tax=Aquiflexum sp. TaxID=1872584 RepID=UPI0035939BA0